MGKDIPIKCKDCHLQPICTEFNELMQDYGNERRWVKASQTFTTPVLQLLSEMVDKTSIEEIQKSNELRQLIMDWADINTVDIKSLVFHLSTIFGYILSKSLTAEEFHQIVGKSNGN